MVGDSHASHAVGNSLVHQALDARLTVQDGVISMYMEMYEILHFLFPLLFLSLKDTAKWREYQKNS
jgi:hypothetical protein